MKQKIKELSQNPLISGSLIVFFGFLSGNFFNFIFNVFMSRNLSVSDYGTLASLASIILFCALAADSFVPTLVHFVSTYLVMDDLGKVSSLFWKMTKLGSIIGAIILMIFVVFSKTIANFFNIGNQNLVILVGLTVFLIYVSIINRAILQAKLAFKFLSFVNIFSSILKLLIGIGLVFLGFGLYGAVFAFFLASVIPYFIMFIPIRDLIVKVDGASHIKIGSILSYGGPATIALLSQNLFLTTDIILVKHFLPAKEAGIYAGLSLLGRIIYFFSSPVVTVMFPIIVRKHTKNEKYTHLFKTSVGLIFISSIILTIFYYFFPEFSIRILLKREEYLVLKPILWFFGIYITIFSVVSVFTNFFLSIKKTKIFIPILFFAIAQFILLWFFHTSFVIIISISVSVVSMLLSVLLVYYLKLYGNR